jgi:hypothetical protein
MRHLPRRQLVQVRWPPALFRTSLEYICALQICALIRQKEKTACQLVFGRHWRTVAIKVTELTPLLPDNLKKKSEQKQRKLHKLNLPRVSSSS